MRKEREFERLGYKAKDTDQVALLVNALSEAHAKSIVINNSEVKKEKCVELCLSFKKKNLSKGKCYRKVTLNVSKGVGSISVRELFQLLFATSPELYNRNIRNLDDIKTATKDVILKLLELYKEKKRLEARANNRKTLASYFKRNVYENVTNGQDEFFLANLEEICTGNYLNTIHDTESKKELHLQLLDKIVTEIDLNDSYSDSDIMDRINLFYNKQFKQKYPKIVYLTLSIIRDGHNKGIDLNSNDISIISVE